MEISLDVSGFTFETKPVTESIATAQEMSDLGIFASSPTLEKEMFKRVATDGLEDRNADVKDVVCAEIEKSPTTAERAQAEKDQQAKQMQDQFSQTFEKMSQRSEAKTEMGATA